MYIPKVEAQISKTQKIMKPPTTKERERERENALMRGSEIKILSRRRQCSKERKKERERGASASLFLSLILENASFSVKITVRKI